MRRGALLNDAQLSGMLPTSVGGGENAPGNWSLIAGFCGPGSLTLLGFLALMAPWGGSFGLPKLMSLFTGVAASAVVIVAAVTNPPAAVAANMSRRENIACRSSRRMKLERLRYCDKFSRAPLNWRLELSPVILVVGSTLSRCRQA